MHKVKITITGEKVHNVGYRLFMLDEAEGRFIPHFDARNVKIKGKQVVVAIAGGDKENVVDFVEYVKSTPHESASVSSIEVQGYDGNIRTTDSFRNSFSTHQLFKIANAGVGMLEILKSVKEDTGKIREDTSKIKEDTSKIPEIVKNTALIPRIAENTSRTNVLIEERFDSLQNDIEKIKRALEREGIMV